MGSKQHRVRACGTVAALALSAGSLGVPAALADVTPAPIAPHQWFAGQVNGLTTNAIITVGCFGPVVQGQTGHPVQGQSVSVVPSFSTQGSEPGYTGESADHIAVEFGNSISSNILTVLKAYGVKAEIPTTISLPCSGTGTVVFSPQPTSSTARSATVAVTYRSIGV